MKYSFKALKNSKERVAGLFVNLACPELLEAAAYTGFKFAIIDNEHGSWDGETNAHMIRAADAAGIVPVVRVSKIDETEIKKALDSGASAIMVPGVSSVEQAQLALRHCKYAPKGIRGACPYVRANQFGAGNKTEFFDRSNDEVAVILLIEGKDGLAAFDDILNIDGVDCVFFGPCDLAVSLGIPGQDDHPRVIEAITEMIKKSNEKGVYCGMMGFNGKDSRKWLDLGCGYVAALSDIGLYLNICRQTIEEINA